MAAPLRIDWYDTPLYYDVIFDEDTERETDFLETLHRRHGRGRSRSRSVLEIACGSGRLVKELASRGWRCSGFDGNAAMLAFAKRRLGEAGLRAKLWQDRMESFTPPAGNQYDLIHCLVSTFKYLLTEADARSCLERVGRALKPGGIFVLGVHLTDPRREKPSHERWSASRDGVDVVCNTRTWPARPGTRLEPMRSRLRVTLADGTIREQETLWEVRSYSATQLRRLIRACGDWTVVACHDFRHEADQTRRFDDEYSDLILVLKKKDPLPV